MSSGQRLLPAEGTIKRYSMKKSFVLFYLNALLSVFIFPALAQELQVKPGRVNSESLIVRAKPASYYERLTLLKKGDSLMVVSKKDDWYEILLPSTARAWVRSENLDQDNKVLNDTCFLNAGAGDFFTPYFHVPQGTQLKAIGVPTDGWTQVQPPENATAWVHADYVTLDEEQGKQEQVAVKPRTEELSTLAKQREELKTQHAEQLELLQKEQQKLAQLRKQAEELQKSTEADAASLDGLQREAERLQALKEAAEAKASLAKLQREKAGLQAEAEQAKLEALKKEAEEKARGVISEKAKWEEEAQKAGAAIAAAQLAAKQQAEEARQEAQRLEQEREAAVLKAEEAIKKAMQAEEKMQETEKRQAATLAAIAELQEELGSAEEKVQRLRQERERMELATRTELAKLEAAKLEAEQLALEKRDMAILLEQSKKEREEITRKTEEEARQLAEMKEKAEEQNRQKEQILAKKAQLNEDQDGQQRLLLVIPVAEKTTESETIDVAATETKEAAASAEKAAAEKAAQEAAAKAAQEAEAARGVVKAVDLPQPIPEKTQEPEVAGKLQKKEVLAKATVVVQPPEPAAVQHQGILLSLRNQATANATHVLCERKGQNFQPVCYLVSNLINLKDWEGQAVLLSGKEMKIKNWRRSIIVVDSIRKQ